MAGRGAGLLDLPADLCKRIVGGLPHEDSSNLRLVCWTVLECLRQLTTICTAYCNPTLQDLPSATTYVRLQTVKLVLHSGALSQLLGAWKFASFETFNNKPAEVTLSRESAVVLLGSDGSRIPEQGFSVLNVSRASFKLRNDAETSSAVRIAEGCVGVTDVTLRAVVPGLRPVALLRLQHAACLVADRIVVREVRAPQLRYASLWGLEDLHSPNLANLRLRSMFGSPTHPACFSNLTKLVVEGTNKDNSCLSLQHMAMLEDLMLTSISVRFADPRHPLEELPALDVAMFNLCTLVDTPFHDLVQAWDHHPSLRRLDVIAYAKDDDMFEELQYLQEMTGATAWMDPNLLYAELTVVRPGGP